MLVWVRAARERENANLFCCGGKHGREVEVEVSEYDTLVIEKFRRVEIG